MTTTATQTIRYADGRTCVICYTVVEIRTRWEKRGLRFRRAWRCC